MSVLVEIACFNLESALSAAAQGVARIELCDGFYEGGTTPSLGVFKILRKQYSGKIAVMIRPRGGHFTYSAAELEAMVEDVRAFKEAGADLLVFGALTPEGHVDEAACQLLLRAVGHTPCTFHRAFDVCHEPAQALETLIRLGFARVLTSGQANSAFEGRDLLQRLQAQARDRIVILAGGGVRATNLERLVAESGVSEVHASARQYAEPSLQYLANGIQFNTPVPTDWTQALQTDVTRLRELLTLAKK